MTEETVFGIGGGWFSCRSDVVSACVVRDQNGAALDIAIVGVRQRKAPEPQIGKEHEHHTRTSHPRPAAEHRIQLSDLAVPASSVQPERAGANSRHKRVRSLNRFPINMKQHRLARSNPYLEGAKRVDTALTIHAP